MQMHSPAALHRPRRLHSPPAPLGHATEQSTPPKPAWQRHVPARPETPGNTWPCRHATSHFVPPQPFAHLHNPVEPSHAPCDEQTFGGGPPGHAFSHIGPQKPCLAVSHAQPTPPPSSTTAAPLPLQVKEQALPAQPDEQSQTARTESAEFGAAAVDGPERSARQTPCPEQGGKTPCGPTPGQA
jgi:hypothetical protein